MANEVLSISTAGVEAALPPVHGRVVRSRWLYSVLTFLTVFGPGLIVMEADNDAGAVSTATRELPNLSYGVCRDFAGPEPPEHCASGGGSTRGLGPDRDGPER